LQGVNEPSGEPEIRLRSSGDRLGHPQPRQIWTLRQGAMIPDCRCIYFNHNRSLQKAHREDQLRVLMNAQDDTLRTAQRSGYELDFLARFKIGTRFHGKAERERTSQRGEFRIINGADFAPQAEWEYGVPDQTCKIRIPGIKEHLPAGTDRSISGAPNKWATIHQIP
jgi:hypothetical protein